MNAGLGFLSYKYYLPGVSLLTFTLVAHPGVYLEGKWETGDYIYIYPTLFSCCFISFLCNILFCGNISVTVFSRIKRHLD